MTIFVSVLECYEAMANKKEWWNLDYKIYNFYSVQAANDMSADGVKDLRIQKCIRGRVRSES